MKAITKPAIVGTSLIWIGLLVAWHCMSGWIGTGRVDWWFIFSPISMGIGGLFIMQSLSMEEAAYSAADWNDP